MASILQRPTRFHPGLALRLAFRGLGRGPGISLTAVVMLALGLAVRPVPIHLSDLSRLQGSESLQALSGYTTFAATLVDLPPHRSGP